MQHIGADTFNLAYDAENRLVVVKKNNVVIAQFVYDGDGKRVKATENSVDTLFIGGHYEVTGSAVTKYYFAGTSRIAMSKYSIPQNMTVEYLLGDHLGSTSLTTDSAGVKVSEIRYKAWGEVRYESGAVSTPYQFTSQYSHEAEFGLYFYNARWYDSALGRFAQADTIVPDGVQGLDRYAYVRNSPINFTDPTGHMEACGGDGGNSSCGPWGGRSGGSRSSGGNGGFSWQDNNGNNTAFLGDFEGGFQRESLGRIAENTYTGPPNGEDIIGVFNDLRTPFLPLAPDIAIYLNYLVNDESISVTNLYTDNNSDYTIYLASVKFIAKGRVGGITEQYFFSNDSPYIGPSDTGGWLSKIKPNTNHAFSLYGTNVNPTNTFNRGGPFDTYSVNITVLYFDPNSTIHRISRNITLPIP